MISIPGGTFKMGRDEGPLQSRPSHTVTVGSFFLDSTEVTRAEYAVFIKDTNYPAPEGWIPGNPSLEETQLPVINVSSEDAKAFASWRSKQDGVVYRLPTEAEWEYAARNGGRETIYPGGNDWLDNHAATLEMGLNGPVPVGSFPEGRNQWGVYDLLGNVWEWTSSRASLYPGFVEKSSISAATRDWVIARGGSYSSDPNNKQIPMSSTYRDWFSPTFKHKAFGFRLARSIP
jgi:formylglycine-generating enzyme required for sulfatase activity